MKTLLCSTLLSGILLTLTGCVDEYAYSHRPHGRTGYYDDRRTTTHYGARPVYRGERRVYRDDGYDDRGDVRVYEAPRRRHGDVRVVF